MNPTDGGAVWATKLHPFSEYELKQEYNSEYELKQEYTSEYELKQELMDSIGGG